MEELKQLLREREMPTSGTKAELIQRLSSLLGTDEISDDDNDVFEEMSSTITPSIGYHPNSSLMQQNNDNVINLQRQVDELRSMLASAISVMQTFSQVPGFQHNVPRNVQSATDVEQSLNNATTSNVSSSSRPNNNCSVREIAETIPEFDPTNESSLSVEQFVERVESAIQAYQWEEKCLLLAVYSRIKGAARLWLDSLQNLHSNWKDFAIELKKEFASSQDEAEIHFKMISAVRKGDEKLTDYCFRIRALGKRYKLSEKAIVKYAREGLQNREIQFAIAAQKIESVRELREILNEYERNVSGKRVVKNVDTKNKFDDSMAKMTYNNLTKENLTNRLKI